MNSTKSFYYPPGGILIWIIVFIEVITFMIALSVFIAQRNYDQQAFGESQKLLNQNFGLLNTIFLITAGYFMAEAVMKLKAGDNASSYKNTIIAIVFGGAFIGLKCFEYLQKINAGIGLEYSEFYTFYWLLTGFHFIHVLVGIVILAVLSIHIRSGYYSEEKHEDVETGAVFWHMCDLIWLLIFPILYLI